MKDMDKFKELLERTGAAFDARFGNEKLESWEEITAYIRHQEMVRFIACAQGEAFELGRKYRKNKKSDCEMVLARPKDRKIVEKVIAEEKRRKIKK